MIKTILGKIGDYINDRMQLSPEIWRPGNINNATIPFVRYGKVEINIRLTHYNFNDRRGKDVDIHLWIKKPEYIQQFTSLQETFRGKIQTPVEFEWGGGQVLVHYHVPIAWNNWDNLQDSDKERAYEAFEKMYNVLKNSGIDLGRTVRGGANGTRRDKVRVSAFEYRNLIVFGAPGTGKSRYLKDMLDKKKSDVIEGDGSDDSYFSEWSRVTFYPTYSYAQFVGSYKPVMKDVDKDGFDPDPTKNDVKTRKVIAYEFVPGPFLKILKDAIKNKDKNYLLIIEEINRANAAAVFGDVFQLLDRDEEGKSEYSITPSREMIEFLESKNDSGEDGVLKSEAQELRIPSNLYIWATMNSADQGVFPLDTAFKRRWDFEYKPLDDNKKNEKCIVEVGENSYCEWGKLRKAINSLLLRNQVNEDKLLSSSFVRSEGNRIRPDRFKMKVLMYLWEDAARMCRRNVFKDGLGAFSDLISQWDKIKDEDGLKSVFQFDNNKAIENVTLKPRVEEQERVDNDNGNTSENSEPPSGETEPSTEENENEVNGDANGESGGVNPEASKDNIPPIKEDADNDKDNIVESD